jgi:hypothetical protein
MDPIEQRLAALEKKVDAVYSSVEKLRKYFLWTGIIAVAVFVLPLLLLPFAMSQLMSVYGDMSALLQ